METSIYLSDASRCSIRPAHLYRPSKEIQAYHWTVDTLTRLRLDNPDVLFSFADPTNFLEKCVSDYSKAGINHSRTSDNTAQWSKSFALDEDF